jgi:hypothetical protein
MSNTLLGEPAPDPVPPLRRAFRRLQIIVLLMLAAMAGALAWQIRQDRATWRDTQRPIVVLRDLKFLPVPRADAAPVWQLVAIWENAGLSTARNVQTDMHYWTGPVSPGFTLMNPNSTTTAPFDVGPRESIDLPARNIPPEAIDAARATPGYLIVWGGARDHEALPGGRPHITRFCYAVTWIGAAPGRPVSSLDVRTH